MKIAIVSGSPRKLSKTIHVMSHVHDYLNNKSYHLDLIDLADENLESIKLQSGYETDLSPRVGCKSRIQFILKDIFYHHLK